MASVINNLFVCDDVGELPASFEGVAIVKGSPNGFYSRGEGGSWVREEFFHADASWPVGSVFCYADETDPATTLGFGEWELIVKEPVFMWKRLK